MADAELSSDTEALLPLRGSFKATRIFTPGDTSLRTSVAGFKPTRYRFVAALSLATTTYRVCSSWLSAGAAWCGTRVMSASPPDAFTAEIHVPLPSASMRAMPLVRPSGAVPLVRNPK